MTINIAINGLGRIGRCVIRALLESGRKDIAIVAANSPASISDHAHLLQYDSVHGTLRFPVQVQGETLLVADQKIQILHSKDPSQINWQNLGVDIVLECSGQFNKRDLAAQHLRSGAKKVIVSAPCDSADATIVYKVNDHALSNQHQVISIGSCTTNALAPILKILHEKIGVEYGVMTTIHSYTNDQNLVDGSHKDMRRARSAAMSIIPSATGAAKAIGLVLPDLEGKIIGTAVRVPVPNVSMIDLSFNSTRSTSLEEINKVILDASNNEMKSILSVAKDKLVSIDFNHSVFSTVQDPFETLVVGGKLCRVVSWYDNEWGFSNRMLDVTSMVAEINQK